MLDYHLHIWPHSDHETPLSLDQLAAYCEKAQAAGVTELAVTEHLFRFRQAEALLGGFWNDDRIPAAMQESMAEYWDFHATADLEAYVACAQEAKDAGLPIVIGLEVDYYEGQMDTVAGLLAGYPFDVLLGSVHWLGAWRFDDIDVPLQMAEWSARRVDDCWDAYADALEELAASGVCDVLAHPDLIKVAGYRPDAPDAWWDRIAEAAVSSGMAAEVSSAGWRKPVGEQYPAVPLLQRMADRGVPFTTASDAHRLGQVADEADALRSLLGSVGVDSLRAFRNRVPHPVAVGPALVPGESGA
ncbi:MAG TPA: histidinol-phosphatase [Acidimicrobiales bacterium]|jgi:histidinol-phosphatase (PHP family)|nr:histidinol-phosphatase [Acidimicrobiales bacterium]